MIEEGGRLLKLKSSSSSSSSFSSSIRPFPFARNSRDASGFVGASEAKLTILEVLTGGLKIDEDPVVSNHHSVGLVSSLLPNSVCVRGASGEHSFCERLLELVWWNNHNEVTRAEAQSAVVFQVGESHRRPDAYMDAAADRAVVLFAVAAAVCTPQWLTEVAHLDSCSSCTMCKKHPHIALLQNKSALNYYWPAIIACSLMFCQSTWKPCLVFSI
ncbi:hypothetical protein BJV82DRAFT_143758 [Fennellomyces sp. T-0311]|nr:hypothetical protein BJV82DRAFT_143758 [Fennellomyces sp. T-0311]